MTFRIVTAIYILVLSYTFALGQTAKDLETSYGHRENVYSVSEHLWMTPSYGADGEVCMMRVYPKLVDSGTNYPDAKFETEEALKFINRLVPVSTRGARKDGFGMSMLGGGISQTSFSYDNISFVFVSTFHLDKKAAADLLDRPDEVIDFPIDEKAVAAYRREEALRPDDDLMRERAPNPKVLEIYWENRRCLRP
ncbi:MAG TPA: hypothetical protein VE863_13410 [Pyrinomonadaceae bacterium]|jgi:hypothetical protein|nr:hypothetical protein [Pyrinomonadaceae bacterium]